MKTAAKIPDAWLMGCIQGLKIRNPGIGEREALNESVAIWLEQERLQQGVNPDDGAHEMRDGTLVPVAKDEVRHKPCRQGEHWGIATDGKCAGPLFDSEMNAQRFCDKLALQDSTEPVFGRD